MRTTFIQTLLELAEQDNEIWLLCGDLGYSVLEPFAARFPDRYLNVGVAEQNMIGVAAGLALSGKQVFCYSIANFPIMRCLEQIRNDVCYHRLNVRIVAVGGGLAYGAAGYTHHGVEDLAVMRVMPYMTVLAPADPVETRLATQALAQQQGPAYLRLGKAREPVVHTTAPEFAIGKAIRVRTGTDVCIISTGAMLESCVQACDRLAERGVSAAVLSMPCLQPLDVARVHHAAQTMRAIITVEEHGIGGLGTAVAEVLAATPAHARFRALHLPAIPVQVAGSQTTLRANFGIDVKGIVHAACASVDIPPPEAHLAELSSNS